MKQGQEPLGSHERLGHDAAGPRDHKWYGDVLKTSWSRAVAPLLIGSGVVLVDQTTKLLIRQAIGPSSGTDRVELFGTWAGFEYVENSGAAFGVFTGSGIWLGVAALGIIAVTLWMFVRVAQPAVWLTLGVGLLMGGAAGNIIDRFQFGYVVDFISVGVWPKFNIADSAVCLGVGLLVWQLSYERDVSNVQHSPVASQRLNDGVSGGNRDVVVKDGQVKSSRSQRTEAAQADSHESGSPDRSAGASSGR